MNLFILKIINLFSNLLPYKLRKYLYLAIGMEIAATAAILRGCKISSNKLSIGSESFLNHNCTILNEYEHVNIGTNCCIGPEVMFCTTSHLANIEKRRAGKIVSQQIIIEDGCWIGARAIILPGVTIHKGCVIAAGAVVQKNCLENSLYAGVPAKKIKDLPIIKLNTS